MKTIIGNWKMNLGVRESVALARATLLLLRGKTHAPHLVIAPSTIALSEVRKVIARSGCALAAQNMSAEEQGAFTGETSARMLTEAGVTHVLIGHSERRMLYGETDEVVQKKVVRAIEHGLQPIICVGETAQQRASGETKRVILHQIASAMREVRPIFSKTTFIAYEPVWAIGTGNTPTSEEVVEVHAFIHSVLRDLFPTAPENAFAVLYGGSVTGENAYAFLREKEVDGLLVGGASLKIHQCKEIVEAACTVLAAQS